MKEAKDASPTHLQEAAKQPKALGKNPQGV
jgi:hypothetical protein